MKNKIKILLLILTLLIAVSNVFASGGNRTGTAGAQELVIPVGPRGIAMGTGNVANCYGIEALYWNPAGAATLEHSVDILFSHMTYIADIGVEYGAVATNVEGFGVLSFSLKSLSVGNIPITTTDNPDGTGATFSPQFIVAGLSYSKALTDRIAIGATVNYISETMDKVSASGVSFNAGVLYKDLGDIPGLNFGVVLSNLGPQMKYSGAGLLQLSAVAGLNRPPTYNVVNAQAFDLPSSFQIGFAYKPVIDELNSVQVSGTFQNNNFAGDEYKVGAEYGYNNLIFLRGGYSLSPKSQSADYIYGLTAGIGLNYTLQGIALRIDYAYQNVKYFGNNNVFALQLGF
jgi:hypothetical protein